MKCDRIGIVRRQGDPRNTDRLAVPVTGEDDARHGEVAIALVDDTGFDGFDAGVLAKSWRQQPASPAYHTDLTSAEIGAALASAERDRLPKRRDLVLAVMMERMSPGINPDGEWAKSVCRAILM